MRNTQILWTSVLIAGLGLLSSAKAQPVTSEEAVTVAQNWITLIIEKEGNWGGAKAATVNELYDLQRGDRLLGYLFRVQPQGYIVVSPHKGLAPVKAYSTASDLDAESEQGAASLIKGNLAAALDRIAGTPGGRVTVQGLEAPSLPEADPRLTWPYLALDAGSFRAGLEAGISALSYTPGRQLLTSKWHQGAPYNLQCPGEGGCANCPVGCVALAGAQIMHYWAWPPQGVGHHDNINYEDPYNWTWMADAYKPDSSSPSGWADEKGKPLTDAQVDAVANLCREVGKAAGVSYSCDGSTASCGGNPLKDMLDAYEDHFCYSEEATFDVQIGDSRSNLYEEIRRNINANRPMQYCYESFDAGHSVVLDGWMEDGGVFWGHVNDGGSNWVDMSDLPGVEGAIREIRPDCAAGTVLRGRHVGGGGNFVYFDQDATPASDTEYIYVHGQFLPGVTLRTDPATGFALTFVGGLEGSWLYSIKGTSDAAILLQNGAGLRVAQGGCIRFY